MDSPISVKRLLEQIKAKIEPPFASVCVLGEVSNFRSSGRHWYFTLKEEGAALPCAVWASQQRLLKHVPKDGERVVVKGSLNLYVAGGSLTLAVTHCEAAGQGDLQARLRQLEAELRLEGVFDRPKRELPPFPKRIGVVAALGGAALRDVLHVTGRRAPGVHILVFPAMAQGPACVPENLMALQEIQDPFWECDVVLLVRGGGSLEDLWAYNDPELVRAVSKCRLPIVTGVGHEIDTTLVDLASDRRAATPSQAAELVTPDRAQLQAELMRRVEALHGRIQWRLRGLESTLNLLTERGLLRCDPAQAPRQKCEALLQRLQMAHPQRRLDQAMHRFGMLKQRLLHVSDTASHFTDLPRVREAQRRLAPALERLAALRGRRLAVLGARLEGLDPRGPLSRGFALVKDETGRLVTRAHALPLGAPVELQWLDGKRKATLGE